MNALPSGVNKRSSLSYSSQHDELIKYIYDAWHKVTYPIDSPSERWPVFIYDTSAGERSGSPWRSNILSESDRTTTHGLPTIRLRKLLVNLEKRKLIETAASTQSSKHFLLLMLLSLSQGASNGAKHQYIAWTSISY